MMDQTGIDFSTLYANFHQPIAAVDCGQKCARYNQHGVPFCCDTRHAIPSAYLIEWGYLQKHTDLWHTWHALQEDETIRLQSQTPQGQLLVECKGYQQCQRRFRTITCRAFPFFPYITRQGAFTGITYYWEYEDRCWIISHLDQVTCEYVHDFMAAYEIIFLVYPEEKEAFRYHSGMMRRLYSRQKRAIPVLHRNGSVYKVSPRDGVKRKVAAQDLPKFGPYRVAAKLHFTDETN